MTTCIWSHKTRVRHAYLSDKSPHVFNYCIKRCFLHTKPATWATMGVQRCATICWCMNTLWTWQRTATCGKWWNELSPQRQWTTFLTPEIAPYSWGDAKMATSASTTGTPEQWISKWRFAWFFLGFIVLWICWSLLGGWCKNGWDSLLIYWMDWCNILLISYLWVDWWCMRWDRGWLVMYEVR